MAKTASPFSLRDFRFYWAARFSTTIAQNAMVVVIGWQVYDIARRTMSPKEAAFQLGMIGVAQFLPLAALTLNTNWTADRIDRRWIGRIVLLVEGGGGAGRAGRAGRGAAARGAGGGGAGM